MRQPPAAAFRPRGSDNALGTEQETAMYDEFDDEIFLAPETTVSLHFDTQADAGWGDSADESLEPGERNGWTRHALGADSAGDYYDRDEERSRDLRAAIHHMLTLSWD
jgi:hypothetical protein